MYQRGRPPGLFLSTPSARRATSTPAASIVEGNFYPRPPRGGRPLAPAMNSSSPCISIHALREEGDFIVACCDSGLIEFLSTPSARRATWRATRCRRHGLFLSTPSARRATRPATGARRGPMIFLSTPSARRATFDAMEPSNNDGFLSTPSARRATYNIKRVIGAH